VDEVLQERVGPLLPDLRRTRVEVVVVEHHERLGVIRDRAQYGLGDVVVHHLIALVPGLDLLLADVRRVREVPQVVLDEPQDRVGDDVVEAVVCERVRLHQQDLVLDAIELDRDRLAARLALDLGVLLGHRRRDPKRLPVGHQPRQRGNQPAAAATHHPLARL
jgi:hypothetical protein